MTGNAVYCPVARTLRDSINISTSLWMEQTRDWASSITQRWPARSGARGEGVYSENWGFRRWQDARSAQNPSHNVRDDNIG